MGQKFDAEVQQLEGLSYVHIGGTIDEDNDLGPLAGHVRGDVVIVDTARVTEINNSGVRDWVRWLEEVQAKAQVVLVECSPAIVAKLNLISNFTGRGFVKSFYVPYFCQACDTEKAMLVDMDELPDTNVKAPTCRCDGCDGVMAFDDMEESYFAFVKDARRDIPPPLLEILEKLGPAGGERKVLARGAHGSSFAGIPSPTSVSGDFTSSPSSSAPSGPSGSGSSGSSAAALRRLREKTGLKTHRLVAQNPPAEGSERRRTLIVAAVALVLGVAIAMVVIFI